MEPTSEVPKGQRPTVVEIPQELQDARYSSDREKRKEFWKIFHERAAQEVELTGVVRTEIKQITEQIPGLKEAALEAIYNGEKDLEFLLPDGKILIISGSNEYKPFAGGSTEYDEYGDYIPHSGGKVSFQETRTGVNIFDGSSEERKSIAGISLETRVWKFEDGRISSQDGHINAHDESGYEGFGFYGNDAPAEKVLEKVDKVKNILRGYIKPK